jgi:DNA-binding transcriptional LysR family regulator
MDTRSLAAFKAVYETGSIARAATGLFISSQGLSKTLVKLESELDQVLFTRTNRGMIPTSAAITLYPKAQKIVSLLESIEKDFSTDSRTLLTVASTSGSLMRFGLEFLQSFEAAQPELRLDIIETDDAYVAYLVENGRAECGCIAGPIDHGAFEFEAVCLGRHPYVFMVRKDDPLAKHSQIAYENLANRKLVFMGKGYSQYNNIQEWLIRADVRLSEVFGVAEISTGVELVERGDVACIVSDVAAQKHIHEGLVLIPFEDKEFTWDIYFISRKGISLSHEAASFFDFLLNWYATTNKNTVAE